MRAIDQSAPYAELWLGTHPSGPSLLDDGTELGKVVKHGQLPWLLKVLSAGKCLSIQAHPDKALAKRLHETRPDVYKDDNHKPEMAIALTPFEAMCGFRRLSEIAVHLRKHPEFAACISTEAQLGVCMAASLDVGGQKRARTASSSRSWRATRRRPGPSSRSSSVACASSSPAPSARRARRGARKAALSRDEARTAARSLALALSPRNPTRVLAARSRP